MDFRKVRVIAGWEAEWGGKRGATAAACGRWLVQGKFFKMFALHGFQWRGCQSCISRGVSEVVVGLKKQGALNPGIQDV